MRFDGVTFTKDDNSIVVTFDSPREVTSIEVATKEGTKVTVVEESQNVEEVGISEVMTCVLMLLASFYGFER